MLTTGNVNAATCAPCSLGTSCRGGVKLGGLPAIDSCKGPVRGVKMRPAWLVCPRTSPSSTSVYNARYPFVMNSDRKVLSGSTAGFPQSLASQGWRMGTWFPRCAGKGVVLHESVGIEEQSVHSRKALRDPCTHPVHSCSAPRAPSPQQQSRLGPASPWG